MTSLDEVTVFRNGHIWCWALSSPAVSRWVWNWTLGDEKYSGILTEGIRDHMVLVTAASNGISKQQFSQILQGADKSLARPGRKEATATEDFEFHISFL
jgi:hypothetical protein